MILVVGFSFSRTRLRGESIELCLSSSDQFSLQTQDRLLFGRGSKGKIKNASRLNRVGPGQFLIICGVDNYPLDVRYRFIFFGSVVSVL